jgi:phosphatidylinositol glycan class V
MPQIAIPQLVLTVAATTNFHVQIINRLSSGYPVWYLVVAMWITERGTSPSGGKDGVFPQWVIRWMVMYGVLQGLLFAGFLPPA